MHLGAQAGEFRFLGVGQSADAISQRAAGILERIQVIFQGLKFVFAAEGAGVFNHRAEHVIEGVEVAIELEAGGQAFRRIAQVADDGRQRGLEVALDRF